MSGTKNRPHKRRMAAVQEINLTVEQGEFLFLTGSSGAEKSTLLQLISGDLRPTSGAVFLDDINLTRLSRFAVSSSRTKMDEDTIWDILHLLCEINRHGTTIIMATHAKEFVNLLWTALVMAMGPVRMDV